MPSAERQLRVSRRKLLVVGFWPGMGAMLLGVASTILTMLYPRRTAGFGSKIFVGAQPRCRNVTVDTGKVITGTLDNPSRAVLPG